MSDCNACLIGNEPDGYCDVFQRKDVKKSRKEYRCIECGTTIPIGSPYESTFTVFEGEASTDRTCVMCAEIRDAYYCGEETYGPTIGLLWDDIVNEDFFSRFNTACLDKLKTPSAKAHMLDKWRKWKGLA